MKRILLIFFIAIITIIVYGIYDEFSFSPLKNDNISMLFNGHDIVLKKLCNKDYIGFNISSSYFDVYQYKIQNVIINRTYPNFESNWDTKDAIVGKWTNCPLESDVKKMYKESLEYIVKNGFDCNNHLEKDLVNPQNYYSYLHFHYLHQYLLIYCPERQELFYLRYHY